MRAIELTYTPYIWPSIIATLLCVAVIPAVWRRRASPGAPAYLVLMGAVTLWTATQALQLSIGSAEAKILIAKVQYIAIVTTGPALVMFALGYNGWQRWLTRSKLLLLILIPATTLVLVFTNELHGLIWAERSLLSNGAVHPDVLKYGPWFPLFTIYSYTLIFTSTALILWKFGRTKHHRGQVILLSLAPIVPVGFNVFYLFNREELGGLDGTPIGFSVSITLCALALFRYRLFDLRPVARAAVFEGIGDAVIVLDSENRLADANSTAATLFDLDDQASIGRAATDLLPEPLIELTHRQRSHTTEIEIGEDDETRRFYDAKLSELDPTSRAGFGRVILLRDVTARKHAEQHLKQTSAELQQAIEELNRLVHRDPLTELGNRRSFFERLDLEIERHKRYGDPLSLVLADLDHFKDINDRYGHPVGDQVLVAVARVLEGCRLEIDLIARLGGEEFGLILPNTDLEGAAVLAERLRERIEALAVTDADGATVKVTTSLGIAEFPGHDSGGEDLMRIADHALYRAKDEGRNRVCGPQTVH